MFGMLDYRAHKLFSFVHFPFILTIWILGFALTITVPVVMLSHYGSISSVPLFLFLIGVLAYEVLAGLLQFFAKLLLMIPRSIFNFLVDPVPTDGRSNEEAALVVFAGNKALTLLNLNKPASEWTDCDIEAASQLSIWHRLFSEKIEMRLRLLRSHYTDNPNEPQNQFASETYLRKIGQSPSIPEIVLTHPIWRNILLRYLSFTSVWVFVA